MMGDVSQYVGYIYAFRDVLESERPTQSEVKIASSN